MHVRRSRSQWAVIIKAFERSGGSHEEFCAKRDLNLGSFRGWLYRLRKGAESAPEVALVPVTVSGPASSPSREVGEAGGQIVIAVSDVHVRVVPGTDAGYVAALVAELRSRC